MTSAMTSALDFFRSGYIVNGCFTFSSRKASKTNLIFVIRLVFKATKMGLLDCFPADLACSTLERSVRKASIAHTWIFFIIVCKSQARVIEIIQIRETLAIVGEFVLVLQVERPCPRSSLPFLGETFQHTLFDGHRGVIFSKSSINDSASMALFFVLFQQSPFTLFSPY